MFLKRPQNPDSKNPRIVVDTFVSDRCLIDVDTRICAIWEVVSHCVFIKTHKLCFLMLLFFFRFFFYINHSETKKNLSFVRLDVSIWRRRSRTTFTTRMLIFWCLDGRYLADDMFKFVFVYNKTQCFDWILTEVIEVCPCWSDWQ